VGLNKVLKHLGTGSWRDLVMLFLVFFDEDSQRQHILRLVRRTVSPAITQGVRSQNALMRQYA
jgi:hypothetical protein